MGRRLRARKFLVALALIVAVIVALSARYTFHHGLSAKSSRSGVGSAQFLVDTHNSALSSLSVPTTDEDLNARAPLYAEFAASSSVKALIAQAAGVPLQALSVTARTTETTGPSGPAVTQSYNAAPAGPSTPYGIDLLATNELPIVTVSTTAPTAAGAARLAQATISGLQVALSHLETSQKIHVPIRLVLRPLGPATGGTATSSPKLTKAIGYGLAVLVVLLVVILLLDNLLAGRQARRAPTPA